MKMCKYGITVSRLTEDDIELVREHRNSEFIRNAMHYKEYITPEMQLAWFHSINNLNNSYYIIEYQGDKIGLVNSRDIDWEARTAEGGLFIWDERYLSGPLSYLISMIMIECSFYILNWKSTRIKVLRDNRNAIDFNLSLGFLAVEEESDNEILMMVLTLEGFEKRSGKLKQLARMHQTSSDERLVYIIEPVDFKTPVGEAMVALSKSAPPEVLQTKVNVIIQRE